MIHKCVRGRRWGHGGLSPSWSAAAAKPTSNIEVHGASLDVELGAPPVTPLGVVLDLSVRLQTEPLGNGPVLARGLGEDALRAESLLGRHRA